MDVNEGVAFARSNHHVVVSSVRADGQAQMVPVVAGVDEQGRVMISTPRASAKVRNIRRNPRVALLVLTDKFFGAWVQIEGPCEVVERPEAMPLLEAIYRQVSGEHPDWDEFRRDMDAQKRVVLRVTPDRAGPN